jgi:polyisoprenoid-binding protein YceI
MTAATLQQRLSGTSDSLLVHVLPAEVFNSQRVPNSCNACVYEMAFGERMTELAPDKSKPIIVYGAGGGSLDATVAKEKLLALGWQNVEVFEGGLAEWRAAGMTLEGDGSKAESKVADGRYTADLGTSVIRWTGRNLFNHHHGTLSLASGELSITGGHLSAAKFEVNMNSIVCEDLTDPTYNAMLIRHLRDADFFDVEHHPVATFVAESAIPLADCTEGTPNHLLKGHFTLRGKSQPLEIPVVVAHTDARITAQAQFELDRTLYGSLYGSGKFFHFLGKHVVNDHIHLHLKIHADHQA